MTRRSETRVGFLMLVPDGHGKITYRSIGVVDLPSSFKLSDGSIWSPYEEPGDRPPGSRWPTVRRRTAYNTVTVRP